MSHRLPAQAFDNPPSRSQVIDHGPLVRAQHSLGRASSLSPDVLEAIFMFAESYSDDDETYPLLRRAPLNVSHVNRLWRCVALGRRALWSTMRSVIANESDLRLTAPKDLALFKIFIARCGPVLPLTISILFDPVADSEYETTATEEVSTIRSEAVNAMCQYMSLIMSVRHRMRTARLRFRLEAPDVPIPGVWPWHIDNMPQLEHLTAQYPFIGEDDEHGVIDLSACSERIRTCDIAGCLEIRVAEGLTLSNLEVLKFDIPGHCRDIWSLASSWYHALGRMPRLSSLSVVIDGLNWDLHPDFAITLPMLTELRVRFTEGVEDQFPEATYAFLNNLSCPNLKNLRIMCSYPDTPEERNDFTVHFESIGLYPFLKANGGELERLIIGYDLFHEPELLNALVQCTNLRHLHFRDMLFAEDSELLKVLHLERRLEEGVSAHDVDIPRPYCPKLESLTVSRCYIPDSIEPSDIVDMIVGMREKEGSKFEHFRIESCNLEGLREDPRIQGISEVVEDDVTP